MGIVPLQFAPRSNPSKKRYEGGSKIMNGYAEPTGQEGKQPFATYAHTGDQLFATLTSADGGYRARLEVDGVLYVVAGTKVYKVTSGGPVTALGTLTGSAGTELVTMARNRRSPYVQIAIVVADIGWWSIVNDVLTQVTLTMTGTRTNGSAAITALPDGSTPDPGGPATAGTIFTGMSVSGTGIPSGTTVSSIDSATAITLSANATASGSSTLTFTLKPNSVCETDGYFLLSMRDGRFLASDPNEITIDGLQYAKAESNPTGLLRGVKRGPDILFLGPRFGEFWSNVGGEDFAFSRMQPIDVGCYAPTSVTAVTAAAEGQDVKDTLVWAAADIDGNFAGIVMLSGYQPVKISTPAVDRDITAETNTGNLQGDFRSIDGHTFYTISGTSFTWEYDFTTQAWNPRTSNGLSRWRRCGFVNLAGKRIYADYALGTLYQALTTLGTEDGSAIIWSVQPPPVSAYPYELLINALFLDVIPGIGLNSTTTADATPEIMIQYSVDAGKTWGPERRASLGVEGATLTKIVERDFGVAPVGGVTWKFSMSAAAIKDLVLVQGAIDVERLEVAA